MTDEPANPNKVYVPICNYNDEIGVEVKEYDELYCNPNAFQLTFNEYGLCFTFNNRKQGLEDFFLTHHASNTLESNINSSNETGIKHAMTTLKNTEDDTKEIFKVYYLPNYFWKHCFIIKFYTVELTIYIYIYYWFFQVRGCGKERGFKLILDNQKMLSAMPKEVGKRANGYRVFITLNGVVTSNLPYYVAPDFDGEHNFYLHGIHYIVVRAQSRMLIRLIIKYFL